MKKVLLVFLVCLLSVTLLPLNAEAKTLREFYNELDELEAEIESNNQEQQSTEEEIAAANAETKQAALEITQAEDKIIESNKEIEKLSEEIVEKNAETDELFKYLQVSSGDPEYLEYIFGAETITDFIHRSAVVEKLSAYNDQLVQEMNDMIEEQNKLQAELEAKKIVLREKQEELKRLIAKLNKQQEDLEEQYLSISEEVKSTREMIELYESLGTCEMDDDIDICARNIIPPDTAFWRPLESGYVTSEWGYRIHPTKGTWTFHSGIDFGNGGNTGAPVYAAANGKVSHIVYRASCGGNMVFVNHNIKGKAYTTAYLHLHTINVSIDQNISKNDMVGTLGGGEWYDSCTTGPHLHFSIMEGITASLSGSSNPRQFLNLPASRYSWFYDRITRY
jgi:murein DD-endopeptidase MepM/ murein hydrolase activator NlpD